MAKRYIVIFDKELALNDVVKGIERLHKTQTWSTGFSSVIYVASEQTIEEIQKTIDENISVRGSAIVAEVTNRDRNFKPKTTTSDWVSFDEAIDKRYWEITLRPKRQRITITSN